MVASGATPGTFPMAMPPSLRRSRRLRSLSLPVPTTTSRGNLRPVGATMSSVEPLLPVNRSDAAARRIRSPVGDRARWVAAPNFRFSPQNTMRTPRNRVNGVKPSLRASVIVRSFLTGSGGFSLPIYGPDDAVLQSRFWRFRNPFERPADRVSRLLCMFPWTVLGFALGKPFCEGMKGVALGEVGPRLGAAHGDRRGRREGRQRGC